MRISRLVTIALAAVLLATLAGVAFALWSADGSGGGTAEAIVAETITVDVATGAADLYPGGPAGAVHFTLTNPNPYDVEFDSVTGASVESVSGGIGGSPACAPDDLTVSTLPITGFTPVTAAANSTTAAQSIPDVVAMSSSAPDACQGAVFNISLTLSGSQG